MKKLRYLILALVISCSIVPCCYASENIVDKIEEQSSESKELENSIYDYMDKSAEENFTRLQNIEISSDVSAQDIINNLDNALQRMITKVLLFIHQAKGAITILLFVIGTFYVFLFKKDKMRIRAGIKLAVLAVAIYLFALFLPAIMEAVLF